MKTTWERIETPLNDFIAYLCVSTTLSTLKPRKSQPRAIVGNILFDDAPETVSADDVVAAGERDYVMRLPYTFSMLQARAERGADVPAWFTARTEAA